MLERKKSSSIFKCPFCDKSFASKVKLSHHVKETYYKDSVCQTDNIGVKMHECQPLMCEYSCFYCGYMINSQDNLQKHKTECHEADFVRDLKCDTSQRQTYSFPVLPPFYHCPLTHHLFHCHLRSASLATKNSRTKAS